MSYLDHTEPPSNDVKDDKKELDCFERIETTAAVEIEEKEGQVRIQSNILEQEKVQKMADQEANGNIAAEGQGDEVAEVAERPKKNQTPSEPPVTFREFNVSWFNIYSTCDLNTHFIVDSGSARFLIDSNQILLA